MYSPVQDGIEKTAQSIYYAEADPPHDLISLVYCFWELKTIEPLSEDFNLHAIPDACVDIMFNEIDTDVAGVTNLSTTYEVLNLGRQFHYVGIEFLPGVWRGDQKEIAHQYIGSAYMGGLPLVDINNKMIDLTFAEKQPILAEFVRQLADQGLVAEHVITKKILTNLSDIHTVADMAHIADISPRQLQRTLKQVTGFSPHDFLKVLRLQQAIKNGYILLYADQSHFIRSFRTITGYTPKEYFDKFDV
jgi:AraC-like DNA-binding protein